MRASGSEKVKQTRGLAELVVDLVVEDAEAVLLPQSLVGLADVEIVAPIERGLIGVERAAPCAVAREQVAERRERLGLRIRARRALVGGVGGGRALGHEVPAIVGLGVVGLDRDPGVGDPVRGVLRRGGHRGGGESRGDIVLAGDPGGGRCLAQVVRGLASGLRADPGRLDLQRLGETHRVARHVLVDVGLDVRGDSRAREKKSNEDGAKSLEQGETPGAFLRYDWDAVRPAPRHDAADLYHAAPIKMRARRAQSSGDAAVQRRSSNDSAPAWRRRPDTPSKNATITRSSSSLTRAPTTMTISPPGFSAAPANP